MLNSEQQQEALNLLQMLVQTNTVNPPGREAVLAQKLAKFLNKEGIPATLEMFQEERANLVFTMTGANHAKTLLATGHLDTVPQGSSPWLHDPWSCEITKGLIYGRGTADMKGGLAAMLYALILSKREGIALPQDVTFLATAGEETFSYGAAAYLAKHPEAKYDAVLIGEPSDGDLLVCHKGAAWIEVTTHGQTSHGSMPHLGINAIIGMNKFLEALEKQVFTCLPHPLLGQPTCSVDMITGGVAVNVVPDSCSCKIDIRTIPGQTQADIQAFIEKALTTAALAFPCFKADYKFICWLLPVTCPPGDKILTVFNKAAGTTLIQRGVYYYTDASILIGTKNLPFIIYGPGDDHQAHQPDEHISMAKYYQAIEIYKNFFATYTI